MASILDRYGIKEVADVMFYDIKEDGTIGIPVLYLDTLKVSTIEQTAENTSARGGKGNTELISWDYGKEITITLEDALFSAKSMALMFGDVDGVSSTLKEGEKIYKTIYFTGDKVPPTWEAHGQTYPVDEVSAKIYDAETGKEAQKGSLSAEGHYYCTFEVAAQGIGVIDINPSTFPGTYYITGDTYARSAITGKDEFFQFVVPKAKVQSEVTLTMEAEGDPSTFSMNLKVLRPDSGPMMKLIKYNVTPTEQAQG